MWQFVCVSKCLRVGGLLCTGLFLLADTAVAQGFRGFAPSLYRELRNDMFAAKMKITEDQQSQVNEIYRQRALYLSSIPPGTFLRGAAPNEEVQTKMKEFEATANNVLTADQKEIWEARKVELKAEQAARGAQSLSDRDRILALEEEVRALKAEIAKLKAAIAAPPSKP